MNYIDSHCDCITLKGLLDKSSGEMAYHSLGKSGGHLDPCPCYFPSEIFAPTLSTLAIIIETWQKMFKHQNDDRENEIRYLMLMSSCTDILSALNVSSRWSSWKKCPAVEGETMKSYEAGGWEDDTFNLLIYLMWSHWWLYLFSVNKWIILIEIVAHRYAGVNNTISQWWRNTENCIFF